MHRTAFELLEPGDRKPAITGSSRDDDATRLDVLAGDNPTRPEWSMVYEWIGQSFQMLPNFPAITAQLQQNLGPTHGTLVQALAGRVAGGEGRAVADRADKCPSRYCNRWLCVDDGFGLANRAGA